MPKNSRSTIRLLVLDVLKPHKPNIVDFGKELAKANGIENMDISVYAVDEKTETVKVILEGNSLDFEVIRKTIEDFGAVVHSVDKICLGKRICSYQLHELSPVTKHF
ncbi:DUF211 domain-containing protein [Candidatus Woesearchaeota archaeon]|nr:DUF211 domain-containing protein [Candidatus Woesearchaeota archaeon]